MKRRNFFTKIVKGLLGIGIVTALPTPEVETALDLSLPDHSESRAMIQKNGVFYVTPKHTENTWIAYSLDGKRTPDHDITFCTKKD